MPKHPYIRKISLASFVMIVWIIGYTPKAHAQQVSFDVAPSPTVQLDELLDEYYQIDFEPIIREEIEGVLLDLILLIDTTGFPSLERVYGTSNQMVMDSLVERTKHIPRFNPALKTGLPVVSRYIVSFAYPFARPYDWYADSGMREELLFEASMEDFEWIQKNGSRSDLHVGLAGHSWFGNIAEYMHPGAGLVMHIMHAFNNQVTIGLGMDLFINQRRESYTIDSGREQLRFPPTVLLGLSIGKWVPFKQKKQAFHLNFELDYAFQNVTENLGENDPDWVQFRGFSPGLTLSLPLLTFLEKPVFYSYTDGIQMHQLSAHFGVHPLWMNQNQGNGLLYEMGLSYRISFRYVDDYQLKEGFFEQTR